MTTPLLPFSRRAPDGSKYVDALLAALDGRGWRSSKSLAADLGTDDRTIRAAAAASDGRVISGQRGYARVEQASVRDVQHAADWLRHQAREMERRAAQIERALHRRTA